MFMVVVVFPETFVSVVNERIEKIREVHTMREVRKYKTMLVNGNGMLCSQACGFCGFCSSCFLASFSRVVRDTYINLQVV